MIPISIDTSEFEDMFNINEEDIKQFTSNVISEVAAHFAVLWRKEASVLKSSRKSYIRAITPKKINDTTYEVSLTNEDKKIGWLANAVEQGLSGYDMESGFESSTKKHNTKDGGWYLNIPFRQATSAKEEATKTNELFSGIMPKAVYSEAKKLQPKQSLTNKKIPKQYQTKGIRKRVVIKSKVFEEYQRKHGKYEGMQKKYDVSGRGTYFTFRRVSSKSDDNSWIHTGIEARNLADKALAKLDIYSLVDNLAKQYI